MGIYQQERRSTNKLPLSMSAYKKGLKGTKNALGEFAKYYSDKFQNDLLNSLNSQID